MIFILDMNLSPGWKELLTASGIQSLHWSEIGDYDAPDIQIFDHARKHRQTIITCDMDFTSLLALTGADSPSVILIRSKNIMPGRTTSVLIDAIRQNTDIIEKGAILVIDEEKMRIRVLPLTRTANDD